MKKVIMIMTILSLWFVVSCKKSGPEIDFVGFEELVVNADGFWDGSGGEGGFLTGNLFFPNSYNSEYSSWSGFAYSDHTDINTADYTNQFSSIAGSGDNLSDKYAVLYSWSTDTLIFDIPEKVTSISLSNSTYAYRVMENGNPYAKKFGGEDGTDEDWFRVVLTPIDENGNVIGTITIYLADFRSPDSENDFISNAWSDFDLSEAGYIKKLVFEIGSSDVGDYGINTPAYICIDNIVGELKQIE